MWSGGGIVGNGGMGGPVGIGLLHNREQVSGAFGIPFSEAGDLNVPVFILHYVQKIFVIE